MIPYDVRTCAMSVMRPKYALLIGPRDDGSLKDGCEKDCLAVERALDSITSGWNIVTCTGTAATKSNIEAAVDALVTAVNAAPKVTTSDGADLPPVVMILMSGHGTQVVGELFVVPYCGPGGSALVCGRA